MTFQELEQQAMEKWTRRVDWVKRCLEAEDARHNQEIREYIEKAVADIARKCGICQDEVWKEVNYWSNRKI